MDKLIIIILCNGLHKTILYKNINQIFYEILKYSANILQYYLFDGA